MTCTCMNAANISIKYNAGRAAQALKLQRQRIQTPMSLHTTAICSGMKVIVVARQATCVPCTKRLASSRHQQCTAFPHTSPHAAVSKYCHVCHRSNPSLICTITSFRRNGGRTVGSLYCSVNDCTLPDASRSGNSPSRSMRATS